MVPAPFNADLARAPNGEAAYWIRTDDGVRLRIGVWRADDGRNGTVLLFPGRTQYIELHGRTIEHLQRLGHAVLVVDWRGHGLSDRVAADRNMIHVERFSDYQKDVASLSQAAEELELPKPWFLIGSSMGACIGLRALANGLSVSACAFTSPMWGIGLKPMERVGAWTVSRTFCAIGRSQTYCPGHNAKNYASCTAFEGNRITNDGDMYQLWRDQAAAKPELQTGGSSMGWLYQGLAECRSLSKIPAPNVPCIAFCGEQDAIVDVRAIQDRMASWPNGELEMMRDVGHELLLERPLVQERIMSRLSDLSGMVVKCG